jgi:hypothetical protein
MRNYGTGLTPVVAVRQQTDHRPLAPSTISPYRPPRLPLDILHLIFNFCTVFDLLTCRLVRPPVPPLLSVTVSRFHNLSLSKWLTFAGLGVQVL